MDGFLLCLAIVLCVLWRRARHEADLWRDLYVGRARDPEDPFPYGGTDD